MTIGRLTYIGLAEARPMYYFCKIDLNGSISC